MQRTLIIGAYMIAAIFSVNAHAKIFRNSYVSFELPTGWNCKQEVTEWICTNPNELKIKQAIIVLTAKEVGPSDNFTAYRKHLKTPQVIPSSKGSKLTSKVINVNDRKIANHNWIDGMHLNSEVGAFYTRYLATTKGRLAVLITLSAHKQHFTKYTRDFLRTIMSLRVVATPALFTKPAGATGIRPRGSTHIMDVSGFSNAFDELPSEEDSSGATSLVQQGTMGLGLLLLVAGVYIFIRKRKKKQ